MDITTYTHIHTHTPPYTADESMFNMIIRYSGLEELKGFVDSGILLRRR